MFVLLLPCCALSSLYFAHYLSDLDSYEMPGGCSPQRPPADTPMEVALVTVSPLRIFNIQINNISRSGAAQQSPASPARSQHWWLFLIYASAAAGCCWVTRPDIHLLAPITHTTKENCDNIRTEKYFFPKYISNKWFYWFGFGESAEVLFSVSVDTI